jgi:hypothetical protein
VLILTPQSSFPDYVIFLAGKIPDRLETKDSFGGRGILTGNLLDVT